MIRGAGHDITTAACGELIDVDTNLSEESGGGQRQATSASCKTRIDRTGTTLHILLWPIGVENTITDGGMLHCSGSDGLDPSPSPPGAPCGAINEIVLKAF